jgi:hypothetical protein
LGRDVSSSSKTSSNNCKNKSSPDDAHPNPLSFFLPLSSRNRLPSHIHLWDGWGEGFGAWGLACYHDQRGAGVGSGPVASLPHMEPSRCPAGDGSGDTSVALELAPATHVGGQRRGPTGRMPGESPATAMHRLELTPHVWRLTG